MAPTPLVAREPSPALLAQHAGPPHHRRCRVSRPCLRKSQRGRRNRARPRRRRRASVEREEVKKTARRERDLREPTALRTDRSQNRLLSGPTLSKPTALRTDSLRTDYSQNRLLSEPTRRALPVSILLYGGPPPLFSAHRPAPFSAPPVPCPHSEGNARSLTGGSSTPGRREKMEGKPAHPRRSFLHAPYARILGPFPTRKGS